MDKVKFWLTAGFFLLLSILNTCRCQQGALFNQSPYQRQRQQTLLRQQQQQQLQQQQTAFPTALTPFGAPVSPLTGLSPISPQPPYRTYNQLNPQNFVPITAYQNELNYDGSFAYGYSSADGTTAQAQGFVKNLGLGESVEAQVVQGSYSYTSPEGTPITVRYIADENGFRAEGAHIPTPPPIPDSIANSLQYISNVQQRQQQPYQVGGGLGIDPNFNPYQTPYRQFTAPQNLRLGQQPLTPLQLQQQQQQNRFFQQQQNTGQYQGDNLFNQQQRGFGGNIGGIATGQQQFGSNYPQQQQQQQPDLQQQQKNLTAQRQQQQNIQQQQQNDVSQQQQQQSNAQQQLVTQQLQGRPSQLVNPYGYNQYRRYKKATKV